MSQTITCRSWAKTFRRQCRNEITKFVHSCPNGVPLMNVVVNFMKSYVFQE